MVSTMVPHINLANTERRNCARKLELWKHNIEKASGHTVLTTKESHYLTWHTVLFYNRITPYSEQKD